MSVFRNGRPTSIGLSLACWPRDWEPDPGQKLGVGERLNRSPREWEPNDGSEVGIGSASPYGDSLAAVGLTPDNPDLMFAQLQSYVQDPVSFKNADPCWPGARDSKIWWEDPPGTIAIQWPFGGGKWLDSAPKTEAQIRAVYQIPIGTPTKDFLWNLYGVTSPLTAYRIDAKGHQCKSGGFDLGTALGQAWDGVKKGIKTVGDVANALHIPGANLTTALLTGGNLVDAFKADVNGFASAAQIATSVATGNPASIAASLAPGLTSAASNLGIHLNPGDVSAAVSIAQTASDPSKIDPSQIAMTAMGKNGTDAWNVATNFGSVASSLPAPSGWSYQPGASAAAAANHPLTVATKNPIQMHLGKFGSGGAAAYGPYPQKATAAASAGTTAGVGNLERGGGHGGGGRGGGGWRGGGGRTAFRGRGRGGLGGVWWPYVVLGDVACPTWGESIEVPAAIANAAWATVRDSNYRPVVIRGVDGVTYQLAPEQGGLLVVRPCAGGAGVGDANADVLKAMALDLLGSLKQSVPQGATRSVMSFQQAWNTASADNPIATDGKYTQETEGALDAALAALSPASGTAPTAIL